MIIEQILKDRGITKSAFAAMIGVTKQSINPMLQNPRLETLQKFADALDLPIWRLFATDEEISKTANSEGLVTCPHCGKSIRVSLGCASDAGLSES